MAKKNFCPKCGSKKIKLKIPQTGIWECRNCGYRGSVVVEDGNVDKNIKDAQKMDKLYKKLSRRR